ncbi:MAG: hypothetical protein LBH87_00315 [Coriobacteriales bacterium]|nr:hypothetical protein [Coriobacteriales bacterium]
MREIRNPENKRVCDISDDDRMIVIVRHGFTTRIIIKDDGKLEIEHSCVNRNVKQTGHQEIVS